jgi:hypothetical protein
MTGIRTSVRDGDLLRYNHMRVVGPLTGLTVDRLRVALIDLHRLYPEHPALCRVDRAARRWIPLSDAEFATRAHVAVAEPEAFAQGPSGLAEALRTEMLEMPLDDHPLRFLVRDGHFEVKVTHGIGDGRNFNIVVPALVHAATSGAAPSLPSAAATRLPLARATWRHFASDPRRVVKLLRMPRPTMPEPGSEETLPWTPDLCSHYVRSPEGQVSRLRAWRDQRLPGVSISALLFAATAAAFERCGIPSEHPGMIILVDARRYLPKSSTVYGNFSTGPYVVPARQRDPRALHEALALAVEAGQPLAILGAMDLHAWWTRRRARTDADRVRAHPSPRLALTHVGQLTSYAGLPWAAEPHERTMMSVPTPGGPEGVTISLAELDGIVHLNTTFHRSTFDEDSVRRAAELICDDPLSLLNVPDALRVPAPMRSVANGGAHRRR